MPKSLGVNFQETTSNLKDRLQVSTKVSKFDLPLAWREGVAMVGTFSNVMASNASFCASIVSTMAPKTLPDGPNLSARHCLTGNQLTPHRPSPSSLRPPRPTPPHPTH